MGLIVKIRVSVRNTVLSSNQSNEFHSFCSHGLDKMTCINEHIYRKMSKENVNTVHVNYIIQKDSLEILQGV